MPMAILLAATAATGAAGEDRPRINNFRFKDGGDKLHMSVDFGAYKVIRNYALLGPAGVDYHGTPTAGAASQRWEFETWEISPPPGATVGQRHLFVLIAFNENGIRFKAITVPVVTDDELKPGPAVEYGPVACPPIGTLEVICSEIAGHSSAVVPGARDADGNPAFAEWTDIEDLAVRMDGAMWAIHGDTSMPVPLRNMVALYQPAEVGISVGLMQGGQPVQGGAPGEVYNFFDAAPGPVSWNEDFDIAYSTRSTGGVPSQAEKLGVYDGLTHTIVLQQGDPLTGLVDLPPDPSGDETLSNAVTAVHLRNDGSVGYHLMTITNCNSSRYPAFMIDDASFIQSGVTMIGGEVWDSIDFFDVGGTPDGLHWFAQGDTENPDQSVDDILVVDGEVVVREGTPMGGSSVIALNTLFTRMLTTGDWFARGNDVNFNDWAVINGAVVAVTGAPIVTGPSPGPEVWSDAMLAFNGNHLLEYALAGETVAGTTPGSALVFDGVEVLAREGDPVDLDGDGMFDDDLFIHSFQQNDLFLTDSAEVYLLVVLRNGAGALMGDAMLHIPRAVCPADCANGDGDVNVTDLLSLLSDWGGPGLCDINDDGTINVTDLLDLLSGWGECW
jgi:hypothetical protein